MRSTLVPPLSFGSGFHNFGSSPTPNCRSFAFMHPQAGARNSLVGYITTRSFRRWSFIILVFLVLCTLSTLHPRISGHNSRRTRNWRISRPASLHTYRADGLVEVNMAGPHPIRELALQGASKWSQMLSRQSKTLPEAIVEYRRRYQRAPPAGFDLWYASLALSNQLHHLTNNQFRWNFANERNVRLVDEFDQINFDIEPILALPHSILDERLKALQWGDDPAQFQILVRNGKAFVTGGPQKDSPRAQDLLKLISDFSHLLPDLTIPITNHDRGNGILAHDLRQATHQAVLQKSGPCADIIGILTTT